MKIKVLDLTVGLLLFVSVASVAGVLPTSRGGTGSSTGKITLPVGTSVAGGAPLIIPAGTTLATPTAGAIESNGTRLYWTNGSGARFFFNFTAQ